MDERDRFSTRRRLPRRALLARPRGASSFLLSDVEGDASCLAVCRAALGGDGDARYGDATVTIRRTARVVKDALSARLEAQDGDPWVWITDDRVRRAVAVTLQLERRERGEDSEILKDRAFRQLLLDTIQQRIAVSPGARVKLPAYKAKGDGEVSEWKVVSTYPASDFSVVTTATRVTLTLPDDEAVVDGDLNAKEDYSIKMKYARNEENAPRIGGLERERAALREMILMPLATSGRHVRETYGVEFPKGLLLCGPPGVGKTLLVRSVVHECQQRQDVDLHLDVINGAEIMTAGIGDAESALRDIFQRARDHLADSSGASSAASVIFIDELDALCPKRDDRGSSGASHSRVVAQLLTLMDGVDKTTSNNGANDTVVVVGATNLPNAIDPALRRPGRFDRELFVPPPDTAQRRRIFEMHTAEMPIGVYGTSNSDDVHSRSTVLDELAGKAIGYVGADIAALCREALAVASTRHFVEVVRDRELAAWWEDVKRRGQSVLESIENLSAGGVAGRAWSANPVAIPLWFLAKHKTDNARAVANGGDYFSFLLGSASVEGDIAMPSQDTEAIKSNRNIDDNAKDSERSFQVTMEDFDQAMTVVVASTLRGTSGFMKGVDSRGWDSIGGQDETKLALQQALEWPLKFPQTFTRMGIQPPRGVLLYGPPGCSKSSIVRAAAHASGATFLSLPAAAVFSPYFGDAEAAIRQVFRDARRALPAIIFFDEIDVLVAKRSFDGGDSGEDSSSSTAMRILSTLLNEMDGVESADGLLVIGATNVPERIDAALLRPGRFDRVLFVDLPSETDRLAILEIHARGMPLSSDVHLNEIARDSPYCSGAELENICREAALLALRESIDAEFVAMRHFREALSGVRPVSSPESMIRYRAFAEAMGHLK